MSKELVDAETKEPLFFLKMDWSSNMKVFSPDRQTLLIDLRWMRSSGWRTWEVFLGGKKQGSVREEFLQSFLALGAERWSILDESGAPFLTVSTPEKAVVQHVLDEMTNLYNPTHLLYVNDLHEGKVATISMKHGIFSSFYDLSFEKGGEKERALVLALFSAILLMLKK